MAQSELIKRIEDKARELGFSLVGFTDMSPLKDAEEIVKEWLSAGYEAEMRYLRLAPAQRIEPSKLLPEGRSIISLGMSYFRGFHKKQPPEGGIFGKVSMYAWGGDYHNIIKKKISKLISFIKEISNGRSRRLKGFVDATPLVERAIARRAGLGFIGKNTCIVSPSYGSWIFLAEILLDIPLEGDGDMFGDCSDCDRCLRACPTKALVEPYILDARRCISYHTIENRDDIIPDDVKVAMGEWVFGCDRCQLACPYNKYVLPTQTEAFSPKSFIKDGWIDLRMILSISSEEEFRSIFKGSAIRRVGWRGLQRNAVIVAGNLQAKDLKPQLEKLRASRIEHRGLRDALNWALERL